MNAVKKFLLFTLISSCSSLAYANKPSCHDVFTELNKNIKNLLVATTEAKVKQAPDINSTPQEANSIHKIIRENNSEAFKRALQTTKNLNLKDALGNTPLHVAVRNNNSVFAKQLIDKKANLAAVNKHGVIPFEVAIVYAPELVSSLLSPRVQATIEEAKKLYNNLTPSEKKDLALGLQEVLKKPHP